MRWMSEFFQKIIDLISGFIAWIWDCVVAFGVWLFDKFKWFLFDFGQWAWEYIIDSVQKVLDFSGYDLNLQWGAEFYANINYFFPLNELIATIVFCFTFWLACFVIKVILKAIPTVY